MIKIACILYACEKMLTFVPAFPAPWIWLLLLVGVCLMEYQWPGSMYANALCLATTRAALQEILTLEGYKRGNALGALLAHGFEHETSTHGLAWRVLALRRRSGVSLGPTSPHTADQALGFT